MKVKADRVLNDYLFPEAVLDLAKYDSGEHDILHYDKILEKTYGMPISRLREEIKRHRHNILSRALLKRTYPHLL